MQLNYNSEKLIAGTFGRSIYTIDVKDLPTGVPIINNNLEVTIYPNPSSEFISINSNSVIDEIIIYDMKGALLLKSKLKTIDISKMPTGNYFMKITEGKRTVVKRFLKV